MADVGFLNRIRNYDKEHMEPKIIEKVRKIVTDRANFDLNKIKASNKAAGGLAKWCYNLYRYSEALSII
jgi:dynein heavy chain, axonemal